MWEKGEANPLSTPRRRSFIHVFDHIFSNSHGTTQSMFLSIGKGEIIMVPKYNMISRQGLLKCEKGWTINVVG